jgi:uncharacterized membrane protein YuzA (DUF378 family)
MDKVSYTLLLVGGLNWGLVGFFKYNLVNKIAGGNVDAERVVYAIVGLAAVWGFYSMVMMMSKMGSTSAKKK